jgi:hypothetical protein
MKASEIVEKFKNVLLNADEEQVQPEMEMKEESDIEVKEEEVVLSEQKEEVKESEETTDLSEEVEAGYDKKEMEEMPSESKEPEYVTKEELARAIAEVKAMVSKLSQEEEALEVPQELEAEEKQELSAQEPEVEPIKHSPESEVGKKQEFLYAQKRNMSTRDIVFNKISNF